MIAIIDYGAGNLQSVVKAFRFLGCEIEITDNRDRLMAADAAVLPGVGSFGEAMECLKNSGLARPTADYIAGGKPLLGICLGQHLLFEGSEESPGVAGLGILKGEIVKIPEMGLKVPHMGWNSLKIQKPGGLFEGLQADPYVYFVHSYYLKAADRDVVSATAEYGVELDAAVQCGNVFACQYHPEKSGETGLAMLRNFAALTGGRK